jgi:hypothetical protein
MMCIQKEINYNFGLYWFERIAIKYYMAKNLCKIKKINIYLKFASV